MIGTRLGVRYVLDGGIQRGSGRARITLRLVRVSDAIAIWAGSYDIPLNPGLDELQRVASDVSTAVARHLASH